jgi:hypothetical protein
MSEDPQEEKTIAQEFSRLGKQVADAIHAAWESEDRKKLQAELADGLQRFEAELDAALQKAAQSDAAKQVREQTEKVVADVKDSNVADEVRKGLISGLDVLNKELGKLVEKLEPKGTTEAPAGAAEAPTPEPPPPPAEPPAA